MNLLIIITSSVFFLWCLRDIFFWLSVWQLNGYRPDRFFAYFRTKKHGIGMLFRLLFVVKLLFFLSYGLVIFYDNFFVPYQYAITLLYFFQSFLFLREIYINTLRKPVLNFRAISIFLLTVLVVFIFYSFPLVDLFSWILFIDLLLPLFVSFFVFLFLFPIEIYDDLRAEKALKKIKAHHNLLVISVTGSVGKSQAKDFIAYILSKKFRVIKTDGKKNTISGIAQTILKKLEVDTEIFVAEMSAYQPGEIAALCRFIHPKIGVLTAINSYYLPLFKHIENIRKTNYELVESLPKNGFCLFNGNNRHTYTIYKKSKKKKILYGSSTDLQVKSEKNAIIAHTTLHTAKRNSFDLEVYGKTMHVTVAPSHQIEYLLPGIFIAQHLGMSVAQIKKAVASF